MRRGERKTFGHTISNNTKNQDRAPLSSAATFLEKANLGIFFGGVGGGNKMTPASKNILENDTFFFPI